MPSEKAASRDNGMKNVNAPVSRAPWQRPAHLIKLDHAIQMQSRVRDLPLCAVYASNHLPGWYATNDCNSPTGTLQLPSKALARKSSRRVLESSPLPILPNFMLTRQKALAFGEKIIDSALPLRGVIDETILWTRDALSEISFPNTRGR